MYINLTVRDSPCQCIICGNSHVDRSGSILVYICLLAVLVPGTDNVVPGSRYSLGTRLFASSQFGNMPRAGDAYVDLLIIWWFLLLTKFSRGQVSLFSTGISRSRDA